MEIIVDTNILRDFIENKRQLSIKYLYRIHLSSLIEIIDSYVDDDNSGAKLDNCFKYLLNNKFSIASNFESENSVLDLNGFINNGELSNRYYKLKLKDCEYNANIITSFYIVMEVLWASAFLKGLNRDNAVLKEYINNTRYQDIQDHIMISLYMAKKSKEFKFFYYIFLHQNIVSIIKKYDNDNGLIYKLLSIDSVEGFYSKIDDKKSIDNINRNWKILFMKRIDRLNNITFKKYLEKLFDKYFVQSGKLQLNAIIDARVMSLANDKSVILTNDKEMKKFMIANGFDNSIHSKIYAEFGYSFNN